MGVPSLNEAMKEGTQGLGRADTRTAQAFAAQDREPNLDLVEPRTMGGQPVEGDLGPLGGAPVHHGLLFMIARIVHNQMPAAVGVAGAQRPQEVTKLQVRMSLIALREDLASADLKGGKEIDRAMAEVLKLLALRPSRDARAKSGASAPGLGGGSSHQDRARDTAGGDADRDR